MAASQLESFRPRPPATCEGSLIRLCTTPTLRSGQAGPLRCLVIIIDEPRKLEALPTGDKQVGRLAGPPSVAAP